MSTGTVCHREIVIVSYQEVVIWNSSVLHRLDLPCYLDLLVYLVCSSFHQPDIFQAYHPAEHSLHYTEMHKHLRLIQCYQVYSWELHLLEGDTELDKQKHDNILPKITNYSMCLCLYSVSYYGMYLLCMWRYHHSSSHHFDMSLHCYLLAQNQHHMKNYMHH